MVEPVIPLADAEGVLRYQEGHALNKSSEIIDAHGNVILGEMVITREVENAGVVRGRRFGDYNMSDQFYPNKYAI